MVRPRRLARIAAVRPTDDVPPRISNAWPGCASSPIVSAPYAVCSISGTAPRVVHGQFPDAFAIGTVGTTIEL
jgi:hypothetical protein